MEMGSHRSSRVTCTVQKETSDRKVATHTTLTPELIEEKFGNQVDLVIDGGIGGIEPSTIVDCTNEEAEIVRQGKGILNE